MIRSILYLLRIGPGWDVEDGDGMPGKDFGPNWIRGLFFCLYRVMWCRDDAVRVSYFFEYVEYTKEAEPVIAVYKGRKTARVIHGSYSQWKGQWKG